MSVEPHNAETGAQLVSARPSLRVCIIQPVLKKYRVAFFLALQGELARRGIDLVVVYGKPWPDELARGDNAELAAPLGTRVANWRLFDALLIQPTILPWLRADLLIVEHANKHALNYLFTVLRSLRIKRLAYWGHGRDYQATDTGLQQLIKAWTLKHADWWFAYNQEAAAYVSARGFPRERITAVGNSVDTTELKAQLASVTPEEQRTTVEAMGWLASDRILVACGSVYLGKGIEELIEASDLMHALQADIRLLVIGGGPGLERARELASSRPWVRCVGPRFGRDKAVLLSRAELWLNPGLIGLGVLDAFCAALPVITRAEGMRSPEATYVEDGINGSIVAGDMRCYVEAVVDILRDRSRLLRLQDGARANAKAYSIESMATNFADGIVACLECRR